MDVLTVHTGLSGKAWPTLMKVESQSQTFKGVPWLQLLDAAGYNQCFHSHQAIDYFISGNLLDSHQTTYVVYPGTNLCCHDWKTVLFFKPPCLLHGFLKAALWKQLRDGEVGGGCFVFIVCSDCYCEGFAFSSVSTGAAAVSSPKVSFLRIKSLWSHLAALPGREGT